MEHAEIEQEILEQSISVCPEVDVIRGIDGFSPIANVERVEHGARITVTDKTGTTTTVVMDGQKGERGEKGESGDYNELANIPSINNVQLIGNKSISDLGLASKAELTNFHDEYDAFTEEVASAIESETDARVQSINAEESARINADNGLQEQIDGITASSDVKDIVGTKAELDAYDKSTLGDNDIIKVISDSSHDDAMAYYRYDKDTNAFVYVGKEGPFYTKAESDEKFATQIDLTDYVKKTDYATTTEAGAIKIGNYGTGVSNGTIYASTIPYSTYNQPNIPNSYFVGKGTLENVLNGRKYLMPEYTQTLPAQGSDNRLYLVPATEQPDVLKSAEGKEVTLTDASQGDLEWGAIKGETSQASTSGKNLLNPNGSKTISSSITMTATDIDTLTGGVTLTLTGTATSQHSGLLRYTNVQLEANTQYTLSREFTVITGATTWAGAVRVMIGSTYTTPSIDPKTTFTTDSTGKVDILLYAGYNLPAGTYNSSVRFSKVMLEKGTSKTDFEPYTAGASPNPTYPQEVKTVTGSNKVTVRGKNLLNEEYLRTATYTTNVYKATDAGFDLPNATYTLRAEVKPNKTKITGLYVALSKVPNPNSTSTRLFAIRDGNVVQPYERLTFNGQMYFSFYPTTVNIEDILDTYNFMFEAGGEPSTYEPYHEQSVEVNLNGKNMFNKATTNVGYYINEGDGKLSASGNSSVSDFIKIKPSTTYTYQCGTAGYKRVGFYTEANQNTFVSVSGQAEGNASYTFITPATAKYLRFQYRNEYVNTAQLEEGSTATVFEPYSPIELCKIGTHQDRIYKDSEGWKLRKEISHFKYDTSMSLGSFNTHSGKNITFQIQKSDALKMEDQDQFGTMSNIFKGSTMRWTWNGTDVNAVSQASNGNYLQISLPTGTVADMTEAGQYLVDNNAEFYYTLKTPTDTLITNSALIEQLDQLSTLATAKGYNLVFTATEHEQPTLAFEYYRPDPTVTKDEYIWVENHYEQLGGHKKFAHNLTVNTHTALGHWQYSFQITTDTHEHFTQLSQVAKYIADHHAGLTLPISGTYTEGNDIYFITKLEGYSSTQVAIEMRKLSDGSLRRITTGAVDVMDYIS